MGNMMELTYETYLRLPELLRLQDPRSDPEEHDEMLFIVIHQVYELWFKLLLHEIHKICRDFSAGDLFGAIGGFKRIRTVMKTLVGQLDILETMTPLSFSAFRERLETASGFQSVQFREFEFVMGFKRPELVRGDTFGSRNLEVLQRRLQERSLIVFRRFNQTYAIWQGSDVDIDERLREAQHNVNRSFSLAEALETLVGMLPSFFLMDIVVQTFQLPVLTHQFCHPKTQVHRGNFDNRYSHLNHPEHGH